MERLAREVMRVFAVALSLPIAYFDDKIDNHFAAFHALHYGAQTEAPKPGQLRAGAHSDFGSLTILMPPAEGGMGLEVLRPDGSFAPVDPPDEGWRTRRMSLGFFCHPNYDAVVEALPGTVPPGAASQHPPVLAGVYMNQKISAVRRPAT